MYTEG
jgi:hypothetical protein